MDPNNFFLKTKIDTPKFSTRMIKDAHVVYKDHRTKVFNLAVSPEEFFPDSTFNLFKKCELIPTRFRMFNWNPNNFNLWHLDGVPGQLLNFSLNWVLSGAGNIQWNREISATAYNDVAYGSIESTSEDTYEISTIGHQCLVNTSIPHRVVTDNAGRISLCLIWDNHSSICSFQEAGKRFKSVGLI